MIDKIKKWFRKWKYAEESVLVFAGLKKYDKARGLLNDLLTSRFFLGYFIGCVVVAVLFLLLSLSR